ncbi:hypothetical protein [Achromobacter sp. UBA4530]|uniref:hypothetical protein n=1 Tax=Achromobacter sp. UBA4530 TaxID=1945912 RepID=UPI00257C6128|nr:hypothetical protein [Achromobacter sp. UBA4530]
MPAISARAACAADEAALSASSATAAASARRPFNIVIGRVRRRDIQGGITIPAIAAVTAIGSPACAARPGFADDQGARSGMMGESKRDQRQAKTKLQRHTAHLVDSVRDRIRMSQRQARIRMHRWFILGGGFTRGLTNSIAPEAELLFGSRKNVEHRSGRLRV